MAVHVHVYYTIAISCSVSFMVSDSSIGGMILFKSHLCTPTSIHMPLYLHILYMYMCNYNMYNMYRYCNIDSALIDPRRACTGGLRYLSCVCVYMYVHVYVGVSVCYHSSGNIDCFYAENEARRGLS